MNEKHFAVDIRRSYEYTLERQAENLEIPYCFDYTYSFDTDEGNRYIFLVQEFMDCNLIGLKFYRATDYENKNKYNVLTHHKNPFRFFSTIINVIFLEVIQKFPNHSFIFKGEPTLKELEEIEDCENNSKRFKFYLRLLAEVVSPLRYEVKVKIDKSVALYINKSTSNDTLKKIEDLLISYGLVLGA